MKLIPFGECIMDRVELSKRYKLIEYKNGIWRLTEKCVRSYDAIAYLKYLTGKAGNPKRVNETDLDCESVQELEEVNPREKLVQEILSL